MLIVCAPGYPGTTGEAQGTMDAFADAVASASGWANQSLGAQYYETLAAGRERLRQPDAVLAMVTLPFFLSEGQALGLEPHLQVVQAKGAAETWSLVAKKGQVASAKGLDGWEVAGSAGYAPAFVRGPALSEWGTLPASTTITFAPAALTLLKRAASGERVAVLLDSAGAAALPTLPFAADLEVVARSPAMPGSLVCTVRGRLPAKDTNAVIKGLQRLDKTAAGKDILAGMEIVRFEPYDDKALGAARGAYFKALQGGK